MDSNRITQTILLVLSLVCMLFIGHAIKKERAYMERQIILQNRIDSLKIELNK